MGVGIHRRLDNALGIDESSLRLCRLMHEVIFCITRCHSSAEESYQKNDARSGYDITAIHVVSQECGKRRYQECGKRRYIG